MDVALRICTTRTQLSRSWRGVKRHRVPALLVSKVNWTWELTIYGRSLGFVTRDFSSKTRVLICRYQAAASRDMTCDAVAFLPAGWQ